MCGIAGIFNFAGTQKKIEKSLLAKMCDTMIHRGPDGSGQWISEDFKIGLGHRRLSIIDLSEAANQPMSNEDKSLWIVFNGEIYNHVDIKKELEQSGGHRWKTDHSDTEMILHAFEEWGIDCFHKFRGMFAVGLWDDNKKELWLIRDRIGIKPLYYSINSGTISFASEIKALLADPIQKREVNEEAFFHYLSFLTTPAPDTLFKGIRKIPNGSWLRIRQSGEIYEHRYWDVLENTTPLVNCSEEEISEHILAELRAAVNLRKVSDVPVGVFLSGGIDSSTNAALFSEGESKPVETFSIGYKGSLQTHTNEFQYARKMAELVNANHHELELGIDDLIDFLPTMVRLQDEPLADPVCVPVYYVSKLARDNGVIVCQVGEGADELFCGYPAWMRSLQLQRFGNLPIPKILKKAGLSLLRMAGKGDSNYSELLRRNISDVPIFWSGADAFGEMEKTNLLSNRLRRMFRGHSSWEVIMPIWDRFNANAWEKSTLNWMSYLDLNLRLPELLLMRVDKMSMGVSLEARVPFLDHNFVQMAMSIPSSVKIRNGTLKYILKKTVRGLIPDELIDRKKQGFSAPINDWILDKLGSTMKEEILQFCDATDFLDKKACLHLIEKGNATKIWHILNFALWWKEYVR
jgi:asparagine synthase (glutamine-hydrolysing)